mmetsp:Transcript_5343/g.12345  ORF Transcript_5343/g.12345 Transcript_5343/m.12345 type:complete len:225 (-) Transcript_5343:2383-3057(-)
MCRRRRSGRLSRRATADAARPPRALRRHLRRRPRAATPPTPLVAPGAAAAAAGAGAALALGARQHVRAHHRHAVHLALARDLRRLHLLRAARRHVHEQRVPVRRVLGRRPASRRHAWALRRFHRPLPRRHPCRRRDRRRALQEDAPARPYLHAPIPIRLRTVAARGVLLSVGATVAQPFRGRHPHAPTLRPTRDPDHPPLLRPRRLPGRAAAAAAVARPRAQPP